MISLLIAFPAINIVISLFYKNNTKIMDKALILFSILTSIVSCMLISHYSLGTNSKFILPLEIQGLSYGIGILDISSLAFVTLISLLYPIAIMYSISYFRNDTKKLSKYTFTCINAAILASILLGLSLNLLTSLVIYETITLITLPLIIYPLSHKSREAGKYYLLFLVGCSIALLIPGVTFIYFNTKTLMFTANGIEGISALPKNTVTILLFMLIFGIAKSGTFPFNKWLPSAMIAPAPVSAIIHAVVVVKSGLFMLIRVVYNVFGTELLNESIPKILNTNLLSWLAIVSIISSAMKAIKTSQLKKRLAYSTISQAGYVVLMVSVFSTNGMSSAMIQLISHSIAKIGLFYAAGVIYLVNGNYDINGIGKMSHKAPMLTTLIVLACLSIIGVPPTVGFYSKYSMLSTVMQSKNYMILGSIIISTLLSTWYMIEIINQVLFGNRKNTCMVVLSNNIRISICALAVMIVSAPIVIEKVYCIKYIIKG
ncbi:proton-conducting transporter membrane subunit [Rickettsiales bacterium]|nr:proton-conducting transporter membrane subunit [Rickettsiales bacterium]